MSESDSAPLAPICIADLEEHAKKVLDKMTWEYYFHGAGDEITRRDNVEAFNRLKIRPRTMRNVAHIDTSTHVLGKDYPFPIAIGPSAMHKLSHPDGEMATSRAAASQGVTMTLSTFSNTSIEDVIKVGQAVKRPDGIPAPDYWLQVYCFQNRQTTESLIRRAEAAGYTALVLTVDTPYLGKRYNEIRNKFTLPPNVRLGNFAEDVKAFGEKTTDELGKSEKRHVDEVPRRKEIGGPIPDQVKNDNDPSISWEETIPWLQSITSMKIIVKGILTSEDAEIAVQSKVDAIWVSNHGGRQLDSCPSTIDALPEIVEVVLPRHREVAILFDSGIARGTDVFKALALGADLCFIGRATLWGLAYRGQEGVELALEVLENEFRLTMGLAGVRNLREITRRHLGFVKPGGGIQRLQ